ncbi:MAG TPA: prepilin-type N-terminal cleavage/methylation domain-containing protein [Tepidisphaeraceae bacterium]|jgi:prepilin-type N-terminal cleavage/methylation domain-containing protein|nr:prepilin-type N-terminal cleavage/methylation domain-containing protein [Tepidisphaeraceae bacterium]
MHFPTRKRQHRGMSLIELAMVAAITSIIAAIALPAFAQPTARQRVALSAQRVASDLRYAAAVSRATGTARTVTVDATNRTIDVTPSIGNAPPARLGDWPFQLTSVNASFGGGATSISFDIWGQPLAGGTVTLRVGSNVRVVSIDGATGEVAVQ